MEKWYPENPRPISHWLRWRQPTDTSTSSSLRHVKEQVSTRLSHVTFNNVTSSIGFNRKGAGSKRWISLPGYPRHGTVYGIARTRPNCFQQYHMRRLKQQQPSWNSLLFLKSCNVKSCSSVHLEISPDSVYLTSLPYLNVAWKVWRVLVAQTSRDIYILAVSILYRDLDLSYCNVPGVFYS